MTLIADSKLDQYLISNSIGNRFITRTDVEVITLVRDAGRRVVILCMLLIVPA